MNTDSAVATRSPEDVREFLKQDADLFLQTCRELEDRTFGSAMLKIGHFDSQTEEQMTQTLAEMEADGCALWPGFLADPDLLEELRLIVARSHHRAQKLFGEKDRTCSRIDDDKTGWRFTRGAHAAQEGITRADFWPGQTTIPEEIVQVWKDPRLAGVVSRYYRTPTAVTHAVAERVFPTPSTDLFGWHVDRIMDQCKVMILLTDVDEWNAPFRYRLGTHRAIEEKKILYHHYFCDGIRYSELSASLAKSIGRGTRVFTGKAGDAVFFDTCGIHARSMCYQGSRDVLNFNFTAAQTAKNRFLNSIRGDDWM